MRANKFNITFHAQDFDETKRFYQDVLRLDYLHGWDEDSGRGAVFALTDYSELEFSVRHRVRHRQKHHPVI